jgi:hypothetical protein
MAPKSNTEIFLPIKLRIYKQSKVNLLKTKLLTIKTHERLKKINELKKLKIEQKKHLIQTIREIKKRQSNIIKLLPTQKEITIKGKQPKYSTQKAYQKNIISFKPVSRIDEELAKIQEKIKNLNK